MTVTELIERLSACPPDAMVYAFDADTRELEPVTGLTATEGNEEHGLLPMVDLHTDDQNYG